MFIHATNVGSFFEVVLIKKHTIFIQIGKSGRDKSIDYTLFSIFGK